MPCYKLSYFEARGAAELSRLLFAYAGVEYEDIRYSQEDWPKQKPGMPMGKMPVLDIDGEKLTQSQAIARYLAKEFGFHGKSNLEQYRVDEVLDTLADIKQQMYKAYFEKDDTKKAELMKALFSDVFPTHLSFLEKRLKSKSGGDGYFVGDTLTLADLAVFDLVEMPLGMTPDLLDKFPKLKAHRQRVAEDPKIAAWVAKRPKTNF